MANVPNASVQIEVPKVLARNSACHQCRRRKLKCDAVRPICVNCSKARLKHANDDNSPEPCSWDEPKVPGSVATGKRPRTATDKNGRKAKLDELEKRIALFEQGVDAQQSLSGASSGLECPSTLETSEKTKSWNDETAASLENQPLLDNLSFSTALIWPDWPMELPCFDTVKHCVLVFFDKVPTLPAMFHKPTFLQNLHLPPSHPSFPSTPLLHAILAITANHVSEVSLASRAFFPTGTPLSFMFHPDEPFEPTSTLNRFSGVPMQRGGKARRAAETPFARFQLWHRRLAWESMTELFDRGAKLVEIIQTQTILVSVDQYNGWWIDAWIGAGNCIRSAIPLEIHESPTRFEDSLSGFSKQLLPEAASPMEQAERDRTWWVAYIVERTVGSSCPWPLAISDSEVTLQLPVLQSIYDSGSGQLHGVQTLHSADFYGFTPSLHADSLSLYVKALKLYSDTQAWFRRYTRGRHSVSKYVSDPNLLLLLSQINTFRLSWPANLRRPTQLSSDPLDAQLVAAHMVTHGAAMIIGEPLITSDQWTYDIARIALTAIRAVLSMLYEITATSYDVTLLPPFCAWICALSIRCLCRFVIAAGEKGDSASAAVFSSEIDVFRLVLNRYGERYPVGVRFAQLSEEIFSQHLPPDLCASDHVFDTRYRPGAPGTVGVAASIVPVPTPLSGASLSTPAESSTGSISNGPASNPSFSALASTSSTNPFTQSTSPPNVFANVNDANQTWASGSITDPWGTFQPDPKYASTMSGFDVSSLSFDFDTIAQVFASSGTMFNGKEFSPFDLTSEES